MCRGGPQSEYPRDVRNVRAKFVRAVICFPLESKHEPLDRSGVSCVTPELCLHDRQIVLLIKMKMNYRVKMKVQT